eukprot:SAG22_NODE_771_length_7318_cov_6.057487_5_plen_127_part_00
MELDATRDGLVQFDEFAAWFATSLEEKKEGSIGFRLLQAKESAFTAEVANDTPMGRMLAAKASAGAPGGALAATAGAKATEQPYGPRPLVFAHSSVDDQDAATDRHRMLQQLQHFGRGGGRCASAS